MELIETTSLKINTKEAYEFSIHLSAYYPYDPSSQDVVRTLLHDVAGRISLVQDKFFTHSQVQARDELVLTWELQPDNPLFKKFLACIENTTDSMLDSFFSKLRQAERDKYEELRVALTTHVTDGAEVGAVPGTEVKQRGARQRS